MSAGLKADFADPRWVGVPFFGDVHARFGDIGSLTLGERNAAVPPHSAVRLCLAEKSHSIFEAAPLQRGRRHSLKTNRVE